MAEVKRYRKIPKYVMAVQITREVLAGKVPDEFKDKFKKEIIINPASRQVLLYGNGRESVTGYLTDWITMDETGYLAIIPHANFIDNYKEDKVSDEPSQPSTWEPAEPIKGVDPAEGVSFSTVTGPLSSPLGEDINLDSLGNKDGGGDIAA